MPENISPFKSIGVVNLLTFILLNLVMFIFQLDTNFFEHGFGFGTGMIFSLAYHPFDAAIYNQHGTGATGRHATIQGGAFECYSPPCRLRDSVLLGMNGAHTMLRNMAVFVNHLFK